MKKRGHEVVETPNGKEAWDELQKPDAPSLVILDSMMPVSLVLCDIDYFKKVNDTFGNLAGDQVLI